MTFRTRFAPSPTGPLHLGHAYSALCAFDAAKAAKDDLILRIDDLDQSRSRPTWEALIYEDLAWLGITWSTPVRRQSECLPEYQNALARLSEMGVTYPCSCTRADIELAASAPQEGVPEFGPDGRIYPGTCRYRTMLDATETDTIRLDMRKAVSMIPKEISFKNNDQGIDLNCETLIHSVGDVILRRRSMGASYHLAVVVDDHKQGVTDVIRGQDLAEATQIHVLLQHLLGYQTPTYVHHDLIRDETGKRLAKRDDARALSKYRAEGYSPEDIRAMIGLRSSAT